MASERELEQRRLLSRLPEGHALMQLVELRRTELIGHLLTTTGDEVLRLQGAVRELDRLIADIKGADKALARTRNRPRQVLWKGTAPDSPLA